MACIKGKNPKSSQSDEDIFRAATAIYNGDETVGNIYSYVNDKTLGVSHSVDFTLCLQYLRTTHTWKLISLPSLNLSEHLRFSKS